ncbi:Sulfate Permease (SulP) Family [Thraustotheca clavata]|uniref:Sulfate Permease (SulP) Family n=1 Tax=Thraustotheca clavata TaxID=74557 RepID=A0A1V9YX64_9STRA|nr:Sulfate Permease (SulP) Family [Thraustotheca clavata]
MVLSLKRYLPWLEWVPNYNIKRDLKFDLIAGITVAMMIIPQEISLSNVMAVPPQYGLYTAAMTPVLYIVFGTSRVLSVANGSEISLMVGTYLQTISDINERIAVGILLSFIVGIINFAMGCLRLGVVADFLSRPVMGGFLSGGGILIMVAQFPTWVQITLPTYSYPLQTIYEIFNHFSKINWVSFTVGLISIIVLSFFKYAKGRFTSTPNLTEFLDGPAPTTPREQWGFSLNENDYANMEEEITTKKTLQPNKSKRIFQFLLRTLFDLGPLVICLIGIMAGILIGEKRIKVTGHVPQGMPDPLIPWYGFAHHIIKTVSFSDILIQAVSIAIVVYSTSVAIAKRLAVRGNYDINANQELLALGFASIIGSFFQIMVPTGAMSRTAVNAQSAKTQFASFITVSIVILVLCCFTNALYFLPKASLAAIIIVAGYWLIEFEEAKWLYRAKRDEFYVWIFSFIITVAFGILPGLFGSIGCSILALMIKTKKPGVYLLALNEAGHFVDHGMHSNTVIPNDILAVRVEGSLYFGNSEFLSQYLLSQLFEFPGRSYIVLDMKYLHDIDATTIQVFEILEERLTHHNVELAFANARSIVSEVLNASGLVKAKPHPEKSLEQVFELLRHCE